jgi:acylphosphatase
MSEPDVCRRVLYFGRVQGVGFRLTASRLARSVPVTGFVRNLPEGSVELVASGSPAAVQKLLDAVKRAMAGHIDRAEETPGPAGFAASAFDIRY